MTRGALRKFAYGAPFQEACDKVAAEARKRALQGLDRLTDTFGSENLNPIRSFAEGSWSPAEFRQALQIEQRETAVRILLGLGDRLLRDPSQEAAILTKFLKERGQQERGKEPITPEDFGVLYSDCIKWAADNPDSEVGKMFLSLDDAWKSKHAGKEPPAG